LFGLAYNEIQDLWIVPYHAFKPGATTLRNVKLIRFPKSGKPTLSWSPGAKDVISSGLFGFPLLKPDGLVYLCEGEHDTIALHYALTKARSNASALGVAGAGMKLDRYAKHLKGRDVILLYDNDERARKGMDKAREVLAPITKSLGQIQWPENLPNKYDINDLVIDRVVKAPKPHRISRAQSLFTGLISFSFQGDGASKNFANSNGHASIVPDEIIEPWDRDKVLTVYKRALHYSEDTPFDILFGSIISNRLAGDPVWLMFIGPPSCGKSKLLMSLRDCPETLALSSLTETALISGGHAEGGGDPSILPHLDGKNLIIKDISSWSGMGESADRIFGILRDSFDGESSKAYGTGLVREYKSRFGALVGATKAASGADSAEMGARFLKFKLRSFMREDLALDLMEKILLGERNGSPDLALREAAKHALALPIPNTLPQFPPQLLAKIRASAKYCARLRQQVRLDHYGQVITESPESEGATRVYGQLFKLASGLAIFRRESQVSPHTLAAIQRVARDSIPEIYDHCARVLYYNPDGLTSQEVARHLRKQKIHLQSTAISQSLQGMASLLPQIVVIDRDKRHDNKAAYLLSEDFRAIIDKSEVFKDG
jgi:hypothetical protein